MGVRGWKIAKRKHKGRFWLKGPLRISGAGGRIRRHLGEGLRSRRRYWELSDVEAGGVSINQLSRILVKSGRCRDEHGNPNVEVPLTSSR